MSNNGSLMSTILAIDDDISILTTIRTILSKNYQVSLAKNVDIAKTILQTTEVNLILLDMEMPGTSGMDFLELLRYDNLFYHIPVIIVSSMGTADVIVEVKKRGAIDFVVKPISAAALTEKVHTVLQSTRKKISKLGLFRKLQVLEISSIMGKSNRVEDCIKDLEYFYYDKESDSIINEICKNAKDMEYNLVGEKVKQLLAAL